MRALFTYATVLQQELLTSFSAQSVRYVALTILRFRRRQSLTRRLLIFDPLRCFPSNTDRQSFLGDLPTSS